MSIENKIAELIAALDRNTEALNKPFQESVSSFNKSITVDPKPSSTTTTVAPEPVSTILTYETVPIAQSASVMPAPPSFAPLVMPVAQPAPTAIPFNDIAGLIKYATDKFYALGANSAQIGNVIQEMGHSNIEHIPPDQFKIFFDKVEAIKKG